MIFKKAKKNQKSEKKSCLFSTVTGSRFWFLGVARCGSGSWCGSEGFFPKKWTIKGYKIFFVYWCGRDLPA